MSPKMTLEPSRTNDFANAVPIPPAAPLMRATLPISFPITRRPIRLVSRNFMLILPVRPVGCPQFVTGPSIYPLAWGGKITANRNLNDCRPHSGLPTEPILRRWHLPAPDTATAGRAPGLCVAGRQLPRDDLPPEPRRQGCHRCHGRNAAYSHQCVSRRGGGVARTDRGGFGYRHGRPVRRWPVAAPLHPSVRSGRTGHLPCRAPRNNRRYEASVPDSG